MDEHRLPAEVFCSHSSADHAIASVLVRELSERNIRAWFAPVEIRGAAQWHDEIGAALNRCDWFLLLLSPSSVKSMWVKRELLFALQQERYAGRIVPILLQPCEYGQLSWVLDSLQIVDLHRNYDTGLRSLLNIWRLA